MNLYLTWCIKHKIITVLTFFIGIFITNVAYSIFYRNRYMDYCKINEVAHIIYFPNIVKNIFWTLGSFYWSRSPSEKLYSTFSTRYFDHFLMITLLPHFCSPAASVFFDTLCFFCFSRKFYEYLNGLVDVLHCMCWWGTCQAGLSKGVG